MKQKRKLILVAVAVLLVAAFTVLYFVSIHRPNPSHSIPLEQRQKQFVEYVNAVQLQHKTPVLESAEPLCASSNNNDSQADCTLSKTFVYKLEGNYRDNGKELFAYLKTKGFDFRPDSKYKNEVEKKLSNTKLADNLSNSEPIIVDLYNTQKNVRVRVSLGDYGRTMPYTTGQGLSQVPAQQLIAGLQFYSP